MVLDGIVMSVKPFILLNKRIQYFTGCMVYSIFTNLVLKVKKVFWKLTNIIFYGHPL